MTSASPIQDLIPSTAWRKSSYSGGDNECIEVAAVVSGVVAVRDSKDSAGPMLAFAPQAWRAFVGAVGAEEFLTRS